MTDTSIIDFSKFKLPWASDRPSIYEYLDVWSDSELSSKDPQNFGLPDYQTAYEREPKDNQIQLIVRSLEDFNLAPCNETLRTTYELMLPKVYEKQFIEFVEEFRISKHLHQGAVPQLARWLVFHAPDREVLLLGSAILFTCNTKADRELIYVLAKSSKYQKMLSLLFQSSTNPLEEEMWRIAKIQNSYARIYLAPLLAKTKNQEIKHWFLTAATEHYLLLEFAYWCAIGGDLVTELSKDEIAPEVLEGASRIIVDMLSTHFDLSIHAFSDAPEAVAHLIRHVVKKPPELIDVATLGYIREFIHEVQKRDDIKKRWISVSEKILEECSKVIEDPKWISQIKQSFDSKDKNVSWAAELASQYVKVDLWDEYLDRAIQGKLSIHDWNLLLSENSQERIAKLAKEASNLKLDASAENLILKRLHNFPGIGLDFIKRALFQKNLQAIKVLESWGPEFLNEPLIEALEPFAQDDNEEYAQVLTVMLLHKSGKIDLWEKYFEITKSGGNRWDLLAIGLTKERAERVCTLAESRLPNFDFRLNSLIEALADFPNIGEKLIEAGIKKGDITAKKCLATLRKWGPEHWNAALMQNCLNELKNQ
ncbi:MAG: hypothetical protein SFY67_16435 [Candidatus Melainabacteria bacterium]|nr:hypothetical protein [Candidatus Melainabacteria bacterium]